MKVGVLLAPPPPDLGEWLADAAAFDAAGADALWIDTTADPELDPVAVTAALAALTFRSLLVTALPEPVDSRTLATIGRLSRGRLAVRADHPLTAGLAGVEATFVADAGDAFVRVSGAEPDRWMPIEWAGGRAAWREAVAQATEAGAGGVLVPAGPPLLDILRNPGDPGERLDLQLAQG